MRKFFSILFVLFFGVQSFVFADDREDLIKSFIQNKSERYNNPLCPLLPAQDGDFNQVNQVFQSLVRALNPPADPSGSDDMSMCQFDSVNVDLFDNAFQTIRNYNQTSNTFNANGLNVTCRNFRDVRNNQYRSFLTALDQYDWESDNSSIFSRSSSGNNPFAACLSQGNNYGYGYGYGYSPFGGNGGDPSVPTPGSSVQQVRECANQTLLFELNEFESRCESTEVAIGDAAMLRSQEEAMATVNSTLGTIAQLISNPRCAEANPQSQNILGSAIRLAASFGSASYGFSPIGLGISMAGDFLSVIIQNLFSNGQSLERLMADLENTEKTNQNLCMLRDLERAAFDCDSIQAQRERELFQRSNACADIALQQMIPGTNIIQFATSVRNITRAPTSNGTPAATSASGDDGVTEPTESSPAQPLTSYVEQANDIALALGNSGLIDHLISRAETISTEPRLQDRSNPDQYKQHLQAFAGTSIPYDELTRPQQDALVTRYNSFFQGETAGEATSPATRYTNLLRNIKTYNDRVNGSSDRFEPFPESERTALSSSIATELRALEESGFTFTQATDSTINLAQSLNIEPESNLNDYSTRVALGISYDERIGQLRDFEFRSSEDTDRYIDRLGKLYNYRGNNRGARNLTRSLEGYLEQEREQLINPANAGILSPTQSVSDRHRTFGTHIEPLLQKCSYAQTRLSSNINSSAGSLSVMDRDDFEDAGFLDQCKNFVCSESPGETTNPGLEIFRTSSECPTGIGTLSCSQNYTKFVCERKSKAYESNIFLNFYEEYLRNGTICGRRSFI